MTTPDQSISEPHLPVLPHEIISSIPVGTNLTVIDCTAGFGGHISMFLKNFNKINKIIGLDRDLHAIEFLQKKFATDIARQKISIHHTAFSQIDKIIDIHAASGNVDVIYADLGVSSHQLDVDERGFSFQKDGRLDMRMDRSQTLDAATVVNTWSNEKLTSIFREFGDEPRAKHIANLITTRRTAKPFESTLDLANLISNGCKYRTKSRRHPATRAFQAIRIAVNRELEEIVILIDKAFAALKPGGRLAIISFHSLEDTIVKKAFKKLSTSQIPRNISSLPLTSQEIEQRYPRYGKLIKPFPILPGKEEVARNPRSRSAKLRIVEKLSND